MIYDLNEVVEMFSLADGLISENPTLLSMSTDQIFDELDMDSVITYKEKVNKCFPKKQYLEMSNQDFLTEIGACFVDRASGEVKIRWCAYA